MLKCATDLIATTVVLPDCIDRRNLVIASEAMQSRGAGNEAAGHEVASSLRPSQ
jgi:hypothetical protein